MKRTYETMVKTLTKPLTKREQDLLLILVELIGLLVVVLTLRGDQNYIQNTWFWAGCYITLAGVMGMLSQN